MAEHRSSFARLRGGAKPEPRQAARSCAAGHRGRAARAERGEGGGRLRGCTRWLVVATTLAASCLPVVTGGRLVEELPDELVDDMMAAHPSMRQLFSAAERRLMQANASASKTPYVGTSYSCVSRNEYVAMATDSVLSKNSRQYTDGSFFCHGYVDYAAACDLLRPKTSCNNKYAFNMYKAFEKALSVFSCKQYSSIWTCQDCKKAYKRWLCSQVYRKYIIPDTDYVEMGTVSKGSLRCFCPFPVPTKSGVEKDAEAQKNPQCVRICNGMPRTCETIAGQTQPTCPRAACGGLGTWDSPGRCSQSIYLDQKASGVDDFYKGARIEMISKDSMTAWWADIEEYDGYTRLAMFRKWNKPFGQESAADAVPAKGDTYRIFLKDSMRGMCRDPAKPHVRFGLPCEQQQVFELGSAVSTGPAPVPTKTNAAGEKTCLDGSAYGDGKRCAAPGGMLLPPDPPPDPPAADAPLIWQDGWRGPQKTADVAPAYKYPMAVAPDAVTGKIEPMPLGGTRCPDTDICVKMPPGAAEKESNPIPAFGYACCPRSGYTLNPVAGSEFHVYEPTLGDGNLNYTCVYKTSDKSFAEAATTTASAKRTTQASIAQSATLASSCLHNMSAINDVSLDPCALKTCRAVCHDVVRKCPRKLAFGCPEPDDFREYEDTMCNIAVPQGCQLKLEDEKSKNRINCVDLNPTGYGPMFYTSTEMDVWKRKAMDGSDGKWIKDPSSVFGLPEEPTCLGVKGLSIDAGKDFRDNLGLNPPAAGPARLESKNSSMVWCADEAQPKNDAEWASNRNLKLQAGDLGCREIKFAGFHDQDCYPSSKGNRKGAASPKR